MADELEERLDAAWREARARGVISEPTSRILEHAAGFVPAAWRVEAPRRLIDLGSGAGVPGVILAALLPSTEVTLVDANDRRCDLARATVGALSLDTRVAVIQARAEDLARCDEWRESVDAVVARLFGPPAELAECGIPLLAPGGLLVVSVSEATGLWWATADLGELGARYEESWTLPAGAFVAVSKERPGSARFPRRRAARRRRPGPVGWRAGPAS